MTEWQDSTLGNLLVLQRGFDLPVQERREGPYPVIASTGVVGSHDSAMVRGPGVVIGRSGSIGGGQYIEGDFWPLNTTLWIKDFRGNDPRFCYFLLRNLDLGRFNAGSGVPTLNRNHIQPVPVRYPDVAEQRRISNVLGVLDDKIDLNRRINATLDAIARGIFRDLFVNFGPTRAKMKRCKPYFESELWALFPDQMSEGLPLGWRIGAVAEFATLNPESWTDRMHPEMVRYLDLSNVKWGEVESIIDYSWEVAPSRARRVLRSGDTIFGTVRPGNGSYALIGEEGLTGSTGFATLRPRTRIDRDFVWYATTAPQNVERLTNMADGAAYPAVRPDAVASTAVAVPPIAVREVFSRFVSPLTDRIIANRFENKLLAELRNLLLPRLISGELMLRPEDGSR